MLNSADHLAWYIKMALRESGKEITSDMEWEIARILEPIFDKINSLEKRIDKLENSKLLGDL